MSLRVLIFSVSLCPLVAFEGEEVCNRHPQAFSNLVEGLEGRRVPAALDQAQEVHREIEGFRKSFLCHAALLSKSPQPFSESLFERSHLEGVSKPKSPVVSLREPPNGITGRFLMPAARPVNGGGDMHTLGLIGAPGWGAARRAYTRRAGLCSAFLLLTSSAPAQEKSPDAIKTAHRKKTDAVVPACKDLETTGIAVDKLFDEDADPILATIKGAGPSHAAFSPDNMGGNIDEDFTWDNLIDCADQTHSESERAEALRVAAMWERWRAEQFQKAYRGVLPIPAGMCKDLDKLGSEVTAGWPKHGPSDYQFPPNYRFPGDFNQVQTQLANCAIESRELNKNKPVPEYVRASEDIGSLNVFREMEKSTATQSEAAPVTGLSALNELERSEVPQISGRDCDQIITVAGLTPSGLA